MRKQIEIQRKFNKRSFVVSKEKFKPGLEREDSTLFLEEETHYDNGESEFVYRLHIKDNLN